MKIKILWASLCALLSVVIFSAALALELPENETMAQIRLSSDRAVFSFTAPVNSEYALCAYSVDDDMRVQGEICYDGEVLASGDGTGEICSAWLVAGERYDIAVSGSGNALIEVARVALSLSLIHI